MEPVYVAGISANEDNNSRITALPQDAAVIGAIAIAITFMIGQYDTKI